MTEQQRTPRARSVHHIGVTVADLTQAIEFYEVFLEAKAEQHWSANADPFLDGLLGYDAASLTEAMIPLGDGYLELLEYTSPDPGRTDPETFNVGHMHLCIEVPDLDAEYERLRQADIGIEFRSDGPQTVPAEDLQHGGCKHLYLRTPDGTTFELTEQVHHDQRGRVVDVGAGPRAESAPRATGVDR